MRKRKRAETHAPTERDIRKLEHDLADLQGYLAERNGLIQQLRQEVAGKTARIRELQDELDSWTSCDELKEAGRDSRIIIQTLHSVSGQTQSFRSVFTTETDITDDAHLDFISLLGFILYQGGIMRRPSTEAGVSTGTASASAASASSAAAEATSTDGVVASSGETNADFEAATPQIVSVKQFQEALCTCRAPLFRLLSAIATKSQKPVTYESFQNLTSEQRRAPMGAFSALGHMQMAFKRTRKEKWPAPAHQQLVTSFLETIQPNKSLVNLAQRLGIVTTLAPEIPDPRTKRNQCKLIYLPNLLPGSVQVLTFDNKVMHLPSGGALDWTMEARAVYSPATLAGMGFYNRAVLDSRGCQTWDDYRAAFPTDEKLALAEEEDYDALDEASSAGRLDSAARVLLRMCEVHPNIAQQCKAAVSARNEGELKTLAAQLKDAGVKFARRYAAHVSGTRPGQQCRFRSAAMEENFDECSQKMMICSFRCFATTRSPASMFRLCRSRTKRTSRFT